MTLLTPNLQSILLFIPTFILGSWVRFLLELGCEDYFFLDQVIANFEQGFDSILTDSIKSLELDTSLDKPDVTSSVSYGFLCLFSIIADTSKLQIALSIRSYILWCQARALLSPVSLVTKMSASKLIFYFSSHPAAFGFWSSTLPDNITLSPANRKVNQGLSEFQTDIGATAHTTLDTEQLISHIIELAFLILFTLYQVLREELFLFQKCMNYLPRFMALWIMLCPNWLVTQLMF